MSSLVIAAFTLLASLGVGALLASGIPRLRPRGRTLGLDAPGNAGPEPAGTRTDGQSEILPDVGYWTID